MLCFYSISLKISVKGEFLNNDVICPQASSIKDDKGMRTIVYFIFF